MKNLAAWLGGLGVSLALVLSLLNYFTPADASPEWVYTLEWINLILIPIPVIAAIIIGGMGIVVALKSRHGKFYKILCLVLCILFLALPYLLPDYQLMTWQWQYFLSACWAIAFLLAGICLFILATRSGALIASGLCICGSLFLGLCAMETALLFSTQYADGMSNLSASSKHSAEGNGIPEYESWTAYACGKKPAPDGGALPAFHKLATFDRVLFDAKYSFNDRGWRMLPQPAAHAENDLLLFGCSFTFGLGLDDEQTWAWQLAKALGSSWLLENYSANGYSVNHMLCLLEHDLIEPPQGRNRYALFLGIDHQLRRNEFFPNTPHYQMNESGKAEAGGKPRFNWAFNLPHTFNGSQLAREAGSLITGLAMKQPEKHIPLYLEMLKKASDLLRQKYGTELVAFLWPDLEMLAPKLREYGIPVILARSMLPDWDTPEDPGWRYRISRLYEPHPNQQAAREIAAGLAQYFKNLANGQENK